MHVCGCFSSVTHYIIIITFVVTINIAKYAIKTGNITQVTLLTNVTCYLSNIVTVTSLMKLLISLVIL